MSNANVIYYHNHHIIPKHIYPIIYGSKEGMNDPSNLIKLTIAEHAVWHYELWVYYGYPGDYLAWKGLAGEIGKDDFIAERNKIAGLKRLGNKNGSRPYKPETQEHIDKYKRGKNSPNYKESIYLICQYCFNEFPVKPYEHLLKFCSPECHSEGMRVKFAGENNPCYGRHIPNVKNSKRMSKLWLIVGLKNDFFEVVKGISDFVRINNFKITDVVKGWRNRQSPYKGDKPYIAYKLEDMEIFCMPGIKPII